LPPYYPFHCWARVVASQPPVSLLVKKEVKRGPFCLLRREEKVKRGPFCLLGREERSKRGPFCLLGREERSKEALSASQNEWEEVKRGLSASQNEEKRGQKRPFLPPKEGRKEVKRALSASLRRRYNPGIYASLVYAGYAHPGYTPLYTVSRCVPASQPVCVVPMSMVQARLGMPDVQV